MLLNFQEESDWWHKIFPKDNGDTILLLKEAPLSDKVLFLRKIFLLLSYLQLETLAMFLILTSNVTLMQFIAKVESVLIIIGFICLLCVMFMYYLDEVTLRKCSNKVIWILNSTIGLLFCIFGCNIILQEPTLKWFLILFIVANVIYMVGFLCLTFKEEWHNSLIITYILYTIFYVWIMLGLVVLIAPNVDIKWPASIVLWIFCAGFYIALEVNLHVRGLRAGQLTTNDSVFCAFLIILDYIIVLAIIIYYLAKSSKNRNRDI